MPVCIALGIGIEIACRESQVQTHAIAEQLEVVENVDLHPPSGIVVKLAITRYTDGEPWQRIGEACKGFMRIVRSIHQGVIDDADCPGEARAEFVAVGQSEIRFIPPLMTAEEFLAGVEVSPNIQREALQPSAIDG